MKDDFETRSKYVASSELEFVNSWKENPLCGDASYVVDPCSLNTFRRSWAERKCNIINSQTFAACHSKVGPVFQDGGIRYSPPTMGLWFGWRYQVWRGEYPSPEARAIHKLKRWLKCPDLCPLEDHNRQQ